jgi:hypothetical protein
MLKALYIANFFIFWLNVVCWASTGSAQNFLGAGAVGVSFAFLAWMKEKEARWE